VKQELVSNLGGCQIDFGNHQRNVFCYFFEHRTISIDFDSDYYLTFDVTLKNPMKALAKARRVVAPFVGKDVTVAELVEAGFTHDIPDKRMSG
jgi:hypothetical protein